MSWAATELESINLGDPRRDRRAIRLIERLTSVPTATHEITKRTGLSRNTVRRWLRVPSALQVPTYSRVTGFSKLSGFIAELEQSFKADALQPKQNRRTGRALFAQIQASGYVGGYTDCTGKFMLVRTEPNHHGGYPRFPSGA